MSRIETCMCRGYSRCEIDQQLIELLPVVTSRHAGLSCQGPGTRSCSCKGHGLDTSISAQHV